MQLNSDLRARLEWMFENQPDLVRELNRSGKLEENLNVKLMAAYRLDKQMKEQGFAKDQIEEAVMSMLAPSDGPAMSDNPPKPLRLKEREAIWRSLQATEAAEQRLHVVKSNPQT